jgi:phosphatidylglycerol---prolipoprotein diacylglyceryl transferase
VHAKIFSLFSKIFMSIEFFPEASTILQIGELKLRFYGAMYALGAVVGYFLISFFAKKRKISLSKEEILDIVFWGMIGGVIGGRIFSMLVYNFPVFVADPIEIFRVWNGGMSIHGGFLGGALSTIVYLRIKKKPLSEIADIVAPAIALGLVFGRIGNFVNGELPGRITDLPWGMDFGDGEMRHPSQLYSAIKDLFLFLILTFLLLRGYYKKKPGKIFALFLVGYALLRFLIEFFREPDIQIGYLWLGLTLGQWLSFVLLTIGVLLFLFPKFFFAYTEGREKRE